MLSWGEIETLAHNEPYLLVDFALREWGVELATYADDPVRLIDELLQFSEGYVL